jgi:phosphoglucosamine mutase
MKRYPQAMINVRVSPDGKLKFYTDPAVKEAVEAGKKALGKDGRIVVRVSGTEPLIRVMTEGADEALIQRIAQDTAKVIQDQLGGA